MIYNIDILKLSKQAFGLKGYMPNSQKPVFNSITYQDVPTLDVSDEIAARSALGTPIYDILVFKNELIEDLELKDAPLLTVVLPINIVQSQVAGQDGTFKQIVSNGDYQISVRGLLVNYDNFNLPPYDQMNALNALFKVKQSFEIESSYLNTLGIDTVVFSGSPTIDMIAGVPHAVTYQFDLLSDTPFELEFNQYSNDL